MSRMSMGPERKVASVDRPARPGGDHVRPSRREQGVPRFLGAAEGAHATAQAEAGTRAGGQRLPHYDLLSRAFGPGHDLSSVKACIGGDAATACGALGAEGFAFGSSIAFAARPDPWLAAHEATHVVQQRAGDAPASGSGRPGDRHERQADAVADRVAAGRSAADLLPSARTHARAARPAVQRYSVEATSAGQAQVGEHKRTALLADQLLYADPGLVSSSNTKLQAAGKKGSYIELATGSGTLDVDGNSLVPVEPKFRSRPGGSHSGVEKANAPGGKDTEGTAHGPMALWTDCGRSSATITGSSGSGDRSVVYTENGVAKLGKGVTDLTVSDWLQGEPNAMANQVYMELLPGFIARSDNSAFVVEGVHYDLGGNAVAGAALGAVAGAGLGALAGGLLGGIGAPVGMAIGAAAGAAAGSIAGSRIKTRTFRKPATIAEAKAMYLALGNAGMDKFDKEAGINFHANPDVGESYSMATEGDMPGFSTYPGHDTWNYHWAGVIMKDGSDNITLENYAVTKETAAARGVSQYDYIDRAWNFAMYGTTRSTQTFHHEHLQSKTHGSHATSIVVRTDK